jgi:NADPH-dependent 2,4-dienoyl-CoA reductase/sulfur reductase-like enzyme
MVNVLHPDSCHFDRPALIYWHASAAPLGDDCPPLARDERCDVAIIGAGYTGLSAAMTLAREHHLDVRILEAASPG